MKLLYRYLLSAAPLGLLLLVLVAASRIDDPRADAKTSDAVVNALTPDSIQAGSPDFTLTVRGGFFTKSSIVQWNGQTRPTEFRSGSLLQARVYAADAGAVGSAYVTVRSKSPLNEYPGVSNAALFRITP